MRTIHGTQADLDKAVETAYIFNKYAWVSELQTFAVLDTIYPQARTVSISITGDHMEISISNFLKSLTSNTLKCSAQEKLNINKLSDALRKISALSYDLEVAKSAVTKLAADAYSEAMLSKPSKTLYNYYSGVTKLNRSIQDRFNHIINAGRFAPNAYIEFKEAYLNGFREGTEAKGELREANKKATRYSYNAVANSYPGNVDELIAWLRDWTAGIVIRAAGEIDYIESEACAKCRENSRASLSSLLDELEAQGKIINNYEPYYCNGIFNGWELILKPGYKATLPYAVKEWLYDKKRSTDIDSYEIGHVYKEDKHILNSNPIIKDLVFNYDFKVGMYI